MPDPRALVDRFGSPLYVYEEAVLRARSRELRAAIPLAGVRWFYAMKANANPALLRIVRDEGFGIDTVSEGEALAAIRAGAPPSGIVYNGNNVTDAEMRAVRDLGIEISVDSVAQLDRYGRLFPGSTAGVRINPAIGDGHHEHVVTGGPDSKFGIDPEEVQDLLASAARHRIRIESIQQHIGSGILDASILLQAMDVLLEIAPRFPDLRSVDFGGGFGIPYRPGEPRLDIQAFGEGARTRLEAARRRMARPDLEFRFEPGRYLMAECGTLLVTVTSVKRGRRHTFVGTDSGFNHLLRPTLYGAYHPIENLSHPDAPQERVSIAGNICESGDLFAKDRLLPRPVEGDVLAIRLAGAYGYSMASTYNLRPRPAEVLLSPTSPPALIRPRDRLQEMIDGPADAKATMP